MKILDALKKIVRKDKNIIMAALALGLAFTVTTGFVTKAYSDKIQGDIARGVIRFHVRANSDSAQDQALKLAVKNRILDRFQNELRNSDTIEETEDVLFLQLDEIEKCAEQVVAENGYEYIVKAEITDAYFPTKQYGDIIMPAGVYKALQVNIGEAEGANWWCVMYPPLCYVDITKQTVSDETKEIIKQNLTDEEFKIIQLSNKNNVDVKIKFKIVEWWQTKKAPKPENDKFVLNY